VDECPHEETFTLGLVGRGGNHGLRLVCRSCRTTLGQRPADPLAVDTRNRCHVRNPLGERCGLIGEHQPMTNSKGQPAIAHETPTSIWTVPIVETITAPLEGPT
jgi:hypothetical protein